MVFFFNESATTKIYTYGHTLSLHDALPISLRATISFLISPIALAGLRCFGQVLVQFMIDRKSTRLTPVTNEHLVCRLLLEKKKLLFSHTNHVRRTTSVHKSIQWLQHRLNHNTI